MFKWLIVLLLLLFLYHVREVFPPFIVGAVVAYLLHPLVRWLSSKGWKPKLAVATIYLLSAASVGIIAWRFLPVLIDQGNNLVLQRREIVSNLVQQVAQGFGLNIDVSIATDQIIGSLESSVGKPEEIVHFGGIISHSLLSILVCIVSSIYLLVDNRRIGQFFLRFFPPERRPTVIALSGQMNLMLSKYVTGQLLLIFIMSCVACGILSAFGIKYALLIGIISGFLEIIPVLGPLVAIIIASVFGISQLGFCWAAAGVPLCYWVARLMEDYVVVPNTIGHAVELHPLAVIFAVLVGEQMAGALGMLIAIPVAASVKVLLDFMYPTDHSEFHHAPMFNPMHWFMGLFGRVPQFDAKYELLRQQAKTLDEVNREQKAETIHVCGEPQVVAKAEAVAKPDVIVQPEAISKPAIVKAEVIAKPEAIVKAEVIAKPEAIVKPAVKEETDKRPATTDVLASKESQRIKESEELKEIKELKGANSNKGKENDKDKENHKDKAGPGKDKDNSEEEQKLAAKKSRTEEK